MSEWLEWLEEIQRAKEAGLTTKDIREWLNELIKEKNQLKQEV